MDKYECDNCGACCAGHLIVEAEDLDILREPRLLKADPHWAGTSVDDVLTKFQDDFGIAVVIACGSKRPCPFLDGEKLCSIYPTRPNVCVAMQAGDEQCQEARNAAGLEPLEPVSLDKGLGERGV